MARKTSSNGIKLIESFEAVILHVYDDGFGYPTAGVGHLLTAEEKQEFPIGTKITQAQSDAWLSADLIDTENAVNKGVHVSITQNQFDAMVSLTFNIGVGGFAKSRLLRFLNAGEIAEAADAFLGWNKAKGKVVAGLVRRRQAERKLFLTPDSGQTLPPVITPKPTDDTQTQTQVPATQDAPSVTQTASTIINAGDSQSPSVDKTPVTIQTPKPSFYSMMVALGTAIVGFVTLIKTNFESAYDKAVDAIDGHYILWTATGFGLILLAAWLYNESRKRNADQLKQLVDKAADPKQNTVTLA